jgi:DNA polymerase-3 subunit gamma/tau
VSALANKYRPKNLADMVGQTYVVEYLRNAITSGSLHHAYLFCGPSGVGKTTAARIFAASVNADGGSRVDIGYSEGSLEQKILDGKCVDVKEIDAASNRSIDDIRNLRVEIKYSPFECRKRFIIVDEAHGLTGAAAEAMLKTLEEPPGSNIFILCTTEPEKLKDTIFGRCITLHFMPVANEMIASRLSEICVNENFAAEDGAITNIARASSGCMRLAIQLLEKCATTSNGSVITESVVSNCCGIVSDGYYEELMKFILDKDATSALLKVNQAVTSGMSPFDIISGLVSVVRNILLIRTCKNINKISNVSSMAVVRAKPLAATCETQLVLDFIDSLKNAHESLSAGMNPHLALDSLVVRMIISVHRMKNGKQEKSNQETANST